jgi:hypothetical protein
MIGSGDRVFVHGGSAVPSVLLKALVDRSADLAEVELVHLHLNGDGAAATMHAPHLRHRALFVDASTRVAVATGAATYIPAFLSDVPALFSGGRLPLDVALLHVSPPDAHGFCLVGVSVDCALAAARAARIRIAQTNPRMPRTSPWNGCSDGEAEVIRATYNPAPPIALPIRAVAPIASPPPTSTRSAPRARLPPPARAPAVPRSASTRSATIAMLRILAAEGAITAARIGMAAPTAKLAAETTAACPGRARP